MNARFPAGISHAEKSGAFFVRESPRRRFPRCKRLNYSTANPKNLAYLKDSAMKSILATLVLAAAALVTFSGSAQAHGFGYGSYGYNSYYTPSYTPVYRPTYVQPVYPSYNYGYSSGYGCW